MDGERPADLVWVCEHQDCVIGIYRTQAGAIDLITTEHPHEAPWEMNVRDGVVMLTGQTGVWTVTSHVLR